MSWLKFPGDSMCHIIIENTCPPVAPGLSNFHIHTNYLENSGPQKCLGLRPGEYGSIHYSNLTLLTGSPEGQMQVTFGTWRDISTAFCLLSPQETQLIDKMNSLDQWFSIFDEYQKSPRELAKNSFPDTSQVRLTRLWLTSSLGGLGSYCSLRISALAQRFSDVDMEQNHRQGFLKCRWVGSPSRISDSVDLG